MRLATTASAVLIALSAAALAQVGATAQDRLGNNMTSIGNDVGPGNATGNADNITDNSAAPPPSEPR